MATTATGKVSPISVNVQHAEGRYVLRTAVRLVIFCIPCNWRRLDIVDNNTQKNTPSCIEIRQRHLTKVVFTDIRQIQD